MHFGAPVRSLVDYRWCLVSDGWVVVQAAVTVSLLRGRPRGRLRGTTTPWTNSSPPHTPHGAERSSAPARHSAFSGQVVQSDFAYSTSAGDSAKKSSGA